jgi:DNA-binding beta-propeller fold protein YncE
MTLVRSGFIPVPPGATPGFDHADVYHNSTTATTRLYVAHTGADRIDVIDCGTNRYLRALLDLPGVAGVLIDNNQDLLFSSDRGCARISVYRCSDETLLGRVGVGPRPNGLAYDPTRRRLFVFNLGEPPGENCTLSVVALDAMQLVATIPLTGRPRWAVYDADTDSVYANIRSPAQIVAIAASPLAITRILDVPVDGPHGLAIAGERMFCAADGAALVVLNRNTGALLKTLPLPGEPDVVMYASALERLYIAIGMPGVVCAVDTAQLSLIETLPTEPGAHTIGWNPVHQTLYVFMPTSMGVAVFAEQERASG